ncbi:MAG: PilZ domain-containing protein [Pseudomonadota bacterium]
MDGLEKRNSYRITTIQAKLEFDDVVYNVLNISSTGLLIDAGQNGLLEETALKMSAGKFQFKLIEALHGGHVFLKGEVARVIKNPQSDTIGQLAIVFEKN